MKYDQEIIKYALFTHHFEVKDFLIDSLHIDYPPKLLITLPSTLKLKWLGFEFFNIYDFAKKNKITLYEFDNFNDKRIKKILIDNEIELLVILGCSQIISDKLISSSKYGAIGTHASYLPELRGSAPINWALIKDLKYTGNTLMKLSSKLDCGEIIDQNLIVINEDDTCQTLYFKISKTNSTMILKALLYIKKNQKLPNSYPQKLIKPLSPRRKAQDSKINWNSNSRDVFNFIRALTYPYPNAFSYIDDKIIMVVKAKYILANHNYKPGYITNSYYSKGELQYSELVACKDGFLILEEINFNDKVLNKSELTNWIALKKGRLLS